MFEKYNLIHFEVTRPLTHSRNTRFESSVRADKVPLYPQTTSVTDTSELGGLMPGTAYCITGSFDYLPPSIRKELPGDFPDSQLFLQSFCVMDSGKDYYTRREGYASILFSYTYAGEGSLVYDGTTYTISPGTGFVIDCRSPHEYHTQADHWQHVDIHLWGTQAEILYRCFQRVGAVTFSHSATTVNRYIEKLLEAYTTPSELRNLYVGNALSDLMCAVLKKTEAEGSAGIPSVYKQLVRYMETHYMDSLSLDDLANHFHISKYHMSREFRRWTGYSPGEYLIMLRIQHASILLAQSDLSIEAIAAQAGFANMSNFIGQIKKRTGMTPSEFRKMARSW